MKILKQLSMILILCLAAEGMVSFLPAAFPGSVMAIVLLALLLGGGVLKEDQIKETADFMLSNMGVVFVPVAVGMIEDLGILKGRLTGFLIVVLLSLFITFTGTYLTVRIVQRGMGRLQRKGGDRNGPDRG